MNIEQYQKYIVAFNSRDYGALYDFFAEDVVFQMSGGELTGKDAIRKFYDFFHQYVRETAVLRRFVEGERADFADVVIRFDGLRDLTVEQLQAAGYGHMPPISAGVAVEVDFFVCYENTGGKVSAIKCGIFEPPLTEQ